MTATQNQRKQERTTMLKTTTIERQNGSDKSLNSVISRIRSLLEISATNLAEAAALVCQVLDSQQMDKEELATAAGLSLGFVSGMERVGRKKLHPDLFFAETPGFRALRRLPYAQQEKYLTRSVPLLIFTNDGKPEELQVEVSALTHEQASVVFGEGRVRTLGEQRAIYEARRAKEVVGRALADEPYRIVGNKVLVMKACQLSQAQMLSILSRMADK